MLQEINEDCMILNTANHALNWPLYSNYFMLLESFNCYISSCLFWPPLCNNHLCPQFLCKLPIYVKYYAHTQSSLFDWMIVDQTWPGITWRHLWPCVQGINPGHKYLGSCGNLPKPASFYCTKFLSIKLMVDGNPSPSHYSLFIFILSCCLWNGCFWLSWRICCFLKEAIDYYHVKVHWRTESALPAGMSYILES